MREDWKDRPPTRPTTNRGRHHDQDGVAGAGAHHQAVAQHNGHHQQEGQGGALAAGIRDKGGSVFPRLLIGLQRLGLPLGAAGHEEGGAPDDDGQRDAGGDEVLSVREPGQAGDGDHRGDEGAYIQAGGSGAVENDAQGGGGEPHAATMGIRIGAMMALEPARVPSRETSRVEVIMEIRMAIFLLFSLKRLTTMYTRLCATFVWDRTSARPEPRTMMKPMRAQKEPREA